MQASLREALDRFTALIENAPLVAVQGFGRDGTITLWNRASANLYGYTAEEALGKRLQDLILEDSEAERFIRVLDDLWERGEPGPIQDWQIRSRTGETRYVMSTMVPVRTGGEVSCVYCMDVDVTARTLAERELAESQEELRRLNAELERIVEERTAAMREAVEDLDSFAFSVTHDLKAPLRTVIGYAALLEDERGEVVNDRVREYLTFIVQSVDRMSRLIDELLMFSRCGRQHISWRRLDMASVLKSALAVQDPNLRDRAEIRIADLSPAYGDATLITQVMTNLLSNALKYSQKKDQPVVEVYSRDETPGMVTYYVRDNGVGFDEEYADKLFAVFQRLHSAPEYEGVGVGLAIVKRIIKRHGGEVGAASRLGEGATFWFTLPAEDVSEKMLLDAAVL